MQSLLPGHNNQQNYTYITLCYTAIYSISTSLCPCWGIMSPAEPSRNSHTGTFPDALDVCLSTIPPTLLNTESDKCKYSTGFQPKPPVLDGTEKLLSSGDSENIDCELSLACLHLQEQFFVCRVSMFSIWHNSELYYYIW